MPLSRRDFLKSTAALGLGSLAARSAGALDSPMDASAPKSPARLLAGFRNEWTISNSLLTEKIRLVVMSDAHLSLDDARGEPFRKYSERMSKPYREMRHWSTGRELVSPEGFDEVLAKAAEIKPDLLAVVGDAVSFPSEAGVEYVARRLAETGLPWMYVAGNHDWHYEGMPGTLAEQRDEWTRRRLAPLYQGGDPLCAVRKVKGVRMVFVDDSDWEIQPRQLDFLRAQLATGEPVALFLHIPLYVRGYSLHAAPVAHPEWGWDTDWIYEWERRPRWSKDGPSATTLAFRDAVFSAPNVVGVFAGHLHVPMAAVGENGAPQLVAETASAAAFLDVTLQP